MSTATAAEATRIVDQLVARREQIVDRLAEALLPHTAPDHRPVEVRDAIGDVFDVIVGSLAARRTVRREDLVFLRPHLRRAVLRGASEAELLRGSRQMQVVIWDEISALAADNDRGRRAILELTPLLMEYVEVASEADDEAYTELRDALIERASGVRFELLEDLLGGRRPGAGPKLNAARSCGLGKQTPCTVVVGRLVESPADEMALPLAAKVLGRAGRDAIEPLVVVREGEIVIVRASGPGGAGRYAAALEEARRSLETDGISLAVAVSTIHEGLRKVAAAYEEACITLESMHGEPGVLALPTLRPLDYLILRAGDRTAWQLIPPAIRELVVDDLGQDGMLIATLNAYFEANLNVKRAAELLYVHPNTAHYRLAKIEERTGCNLRHLDDLQQLVVAIRLAQTENPA